MISFRDFLHKRDNICHAVYGRFDIPDAHHSSLLENTDYRKLVFVNNSDDVVKCLRKVFPKYARSIIRVSSIEEARQKLVEFSSHVLIEESNEFSDAYQKLYEAAAEGKYTAFSAPECYTLARKAQNLGRLQLNTL